MDLFKDLKFQMAVVALIVAAARFFVPDIDETSLIEVVMVLVGLILGGHGIAEYRKAK